MRQIARAPSAAGYRPAVQLIRVAAIADCVHASQTYYSGGLRNRSGDSTWNNSNGKWFPISMSRLTTAPRRAAGSRCTCASYMGLAAGAALGSAAREILGPDSPLLASAIRHVAEPVGQLFLRSLLMTVVPLVVSSLIVGVAGIGDVRRLGRVGVRTVLLLPGHFAVSVFLGILLANTVRPGPAARSRDAGIADGGVRGRVEASGCRTALRANRRSCRLYARSSPPIPSNRWRDRHPT